MKFYKVSAEYYSDLPVIEEMILIKETEKTYKLQGYICSQTIRKEEMPYRWESKLTLITNDFEGIKEEWNRKIKRNIDGFKAKIERLESHLML